MSRFNLELHSDFLAAQKIKNIVATQFIAVTSNSYIIFLIILYGVAILYSIVI